MQDLETFIREHLETPTKDFVMSVSLDPNTSKVVGKFHDTQSDGGEANFRVEGNAVILQSWETAHEKKTASEKKAEEKRIADMAQADRDSAAARKAAEDRAKK